jgi:hypothetical protein
MILLMGFEINAGIVVLREQDQTGLTGVNGV